MLTSRKLWQALASRLTVYRVWLGPWHEYTPEEREQIVARLRWTAPRLLAKAKRDVGLPAWKFWRTF